MVPPGDTSQNFYKLLVILLVNKLLLMSFCHNLRHFSQVNSLLTSRLMNQVNRLLTFRSTCVKAVEIATILEGLGRKPFCPQSPILEVNAHLPIELIAEFCFRIPFHDIFAKIPVKLDKRGIDGDSCLDLRGTVARLQVGYPHHVVVLNCGHISFALNRCLGLHRFNSSFHAVQAVVMPGLGQKSCHIVD